MFVDAPGGTYLKDWDEYVTSHLSARGLVKEQDLALYKITDDIDEAVGEIQNFYSNYHSSRYVGKLLVLRVRQAPDADQLDELNTRFGDILSKGKIEVAEALPSEAVDVEHYPRVTLHFNRRNVGRLRTLIDSINSFVSEPAAPPLDASPHEIVEEPLSPAAETAQEG